MRFWSFSLAVFMTALLLSASAAWAVGNVLLPSENSGNGAGSLPNLGLMPPETLPDATTIAPQPMPPLLPVKPIAAPVTAPAAKAQTPTQPQNRIPTYSMAITLAQPAYWTANDLNNVASQMGITKDWVDHYCGMGFNGMLVSNSGLHNFDSNMKTAARAAYDGKIIKTIINLYAYCKVTPKPEMRGLLQHSGQYYIVPINGTVCEPPPSPTRFGRVSVTHMSNGHDTCTYKP